jgi:hypothetical protein
MVDVCQGQTVMEEGSRGSQGCVGFGATSCGVGGNNDYDDGNIIYNYANDASKAQTYIHFSNYHKPHFKIKF